MNVRSDIIAFKVKIQLIALPGNCVNVLVPKTQQSVHLVHRDTTVQRKDLILMEFLVVQDDTVLRRLL